MTSLDSDDAYLLDLARRYDGKLFLLSSCPNVIEAADALARRRLLARITTREIDIGDGPLSYEMFILTRMGERALAEVQREASL